MPTVLVEREGACAIVTLNRPEVRNALNLEMVRELSAVLTGLESDSEIGAINITGSGDKAFVAGADIEEL